MGQFDDNMDTAIALNDHGGLSQGASGIAGNFESVLAYSATMGPATLSYMYAVSDDRGQQMTTLIQIKVITQLVYSLKIC